MIPEVNGYREGVTEYLLKEFVDFLSKWLPGECFYVCEVVAEDFLKEIVDFLSK